MSTPSFQPFRQLRRREQLGTAWTVFRLQTQLIFSQRVVWFLSAILLYLGILYAVNYRLAMNDRMDLETIYLMVMTMPLLVLTLYLHMQVIITEKEQRTLEVMFTTAGSRHKVWLVRLGTLNALLWLMSVGMSLLVFFTFADFSILGMACSVYATVFLVGSLTLFFAVRLRSSLGAGMVTALVLLLHTFSADIFHYNRTRYFLFFNPYDIPNQIDPRTWDIWAWQNRIGVMIIGLLLLFFALRSLEHRDRLLR
ncbi:MAG: hypothetical protein HY710_00575 [Candidatus Latescibacteria bacterium]|nr:hypothetical protein [Candidatus Latescibacterota bacterium]